MSLGGESRTYEIWRTKNAVREVVGDNAVPIHRYALSKHSRNTSYSVSVIHRYALSKHSRNTSYRVSVIHRHVLIIISQSTSYIECTRPARTPNNPTFNLVIRPLNPSSPNVTT